MLKHPRRCANADKAVNLNGTGHHPATTVKDTGDPMAGIVLFLQHGAVAPTVRVAVKATQSPSAVLAGIPTATILRSVTGPENMPEINVISVVRMKFRDFDPASDGKEWPYGRNVLMSCWPVLSSRTMLRYSAWRQAWCLRCPNGA
jgi:hypothetical protein